MSSYTTSGSKLFFKSLGRPKYKKHDNSRPRHLAVANLTTICLSYRIICTLPVSTMLRAAKAAQDSGYQRL